MIIILSAHYHHLLNIDHLMLTEMDDDDGDDNDAIDKQSSVLVASNICMNMNINMSIMFHQ